MVNSASQGTLITLAVIIMETLHFTVSIRNDGPFPAPYRYTYDNF